MKHAEELYLCPFCNHFIQIREDGTMAPHTVAYGLWFSWQCGLSGLSKLQADALVGRTRGKEKK